MMASAPMDVDTGAQQSDGKGVSTNKLFDFDEVYMERLRREKPWSTKVKFYRECKVSALAAMKMLQHAISGVDKGRKRGTAPVEVMGLCIGKPEGDAVIVMDTFPLPVEGTETKVVADDAQVYITQLLDSMELRRKDTFVGWYHSHPFDVETYSHCHLSSTDVQTQAQWQHSIPYWCAIVVDPLRSLARQEPEFGCYRCYPPTHNPPKQESPDGTLASDDKQRVTRWGVSHNRYYSLEMSYFMSGLGTNILQTMSKNSLWVRVLASSSVMEPENRARFADRVNNAVKKLDTSATQMSRHASFAQFGAASRSGKEELSQSANACVDLAVEQVKGHVSQVSKDVLFNQ